MISRQTSTSAIISGFMAVNVGLVICYTFIPEAHASLRAGLALTYFLSMTTTLAYGAKAFIESF